MKTAVVILNWNGRPMLERFLPSVTTNSGDADIVVADNGSTDDSVEFLRQHYPAIQLIQLDHNYGFAEGYNRAIQAIDSCCNRYDYYVLLNSDVECTPQWLDPVLAMMETDPAVGVAQPKLLMYDRRDTFEYAGGAGGFIDRYGYPFCRGRIFNTLEQDLGQYDDERDIFWATGACMFVRASLWHLLGGLDGDFFAHMEEIDFCWRAQLAGYRIRYCPRVAVYHVGGGTLPKSSPFKTELNFRNNLSMLYKNLPETQNLQAHFPTRGWVLAVRMWLDRVASLKFLFEGHAGEYHAVRRAHRQYRQRKNALQQKRLQNGNHAVGQVYQGLLILEYWILRHRRFSDLKKTFL